MEANNHFNYGSHSSANSGLKLSSGESSYTNGSSTNFPQQGKNLNGELNVNGISTVVGSGATGPQQQTSSYPHLSNLHQSSRGYEFLWGGHPQYSSLGSPHGHQKQPSPGLGQPHYQSRGQFQLNGRLEGSHQPPGVGPPNVPMTGGQFWNSGSEHINFGSHNLYGAYQNHGHHQQQSAQSSSVEQLLSQRRPLHPQQQHYGLLPNGMPYYQHQTPQPQNQAQILPPVGQSYTPPRGSSLPVSSPSSAKDSASPQRPGRDRSPDTNEAGASTVLQDGDQISSDKERPSQKNKDDQPRDASHLEDYGPYSEMSPTPASDEPSPQKEPAAKVPSETSFSLSSSVQPAFSPKSSVKSSAESSSKQTSPSEISPSSLTDGLTHSSPPFRSVIAGRFETTDEPTKFPSSNAFAGSSPGPQSFSSVLQLAQNTSGSQVSTPACPSSLGITPLSSLPKPVHSSTALLKTSCFPDSVDDMHEKFPTETSANSSVSVISHAEGPSPLAPAKSSSSSLHYEVANASPHPSPGSVSGVPMSQSTETHRISSAGNDNLTARPLSTLPRLTTQASRTSTVSIPPESVSVPHAKGTTSGVIQSFEQHSCNAIAGHFLTSDQYPGLEDRRGLVTSDSLHDSISHLDSAAQIKYNFKAAEKPDLPVHNLPAIISPVHKPHDGQTSMDHMQRAFSSEHSAVIQGQLPQSSRISYMSNESYFEGSYMDDSEKASNLDASDELSTAYTTRDGSFSAEDTRGHTFASTAGDSSQSFHGAESSLNSTSQMEEPSIGSTDVSMSHSYMSSQSNRPGRV